MSHYLRIATYMAVTRPANATLLSVEAIESRLRQEFPDERELLKFEFEVEAQAETLIRAARAAGLRLAVMVRDAAGNVRIQADDGAPFPEATKQ